MCVCVVCLIIVLSVSEAMIRAYCRDVGLEFRESMINWEPLSETDFRQIFCAVWEPEWFGHVRSSFRLSRRSRQSAEMIGNDVNFDDEERYLIHKSVAKNMNGLDRCGRHPDSADDPDNPPR